MGNEQKDLDALLETIELQPDLELASGYKGLGYLGNNKLIAFGAVALGSRRKFFQGALD